jgi:hypothetical protein
MSAPQATTDTNDMLPGLCECLGAESGAATRTAGEERQRCDQRGERLAADVARVKP